MLLLLIICLFTKGVGSSGKIPCFSLRVLSPFGVTKPSNKTQTECLTAQALFNGQRTEKQEPSS